MHPYLLRPAIRVSNGCTFGVDLSTVICLFGVSFLYSSVLSRITVSTIRREKGETTTLATLWNFVQKTRLFPLDDVSPPLPRRATLKTNNILLYVPFFVIYPKKNYRNENAKGCDVTNGVARIMQRRISSINKTICFLQFLLGLLLLRNDFTYRITNFTSLLQ